MYIYEYIYIYIRIYGNIFTYASHMYTLELT